MIEDTYAREKKEKKKHASWPFVWFRLGHGTKALLAVAEGSRAMRGALVAARRSTAAVPQRDARFLSC